MSSPEDQRENRRFGVFIFGILAIIVLVTAAFYMLRRDTTEYRLSRSDIMKFFLYDTPLSHVRYEQRGNLAT